MVQLHQEEAAARTRKLKVQNADPLHFALSHFHDTTVLSVNGFEVTATFAENHNAAAVHHVKQILISSFAGKTTKLQSRNILEIPDVQRYNDNGRRYYVP